MNPALTAIGVAVLVVVVAVLSMCELVLAHTTRARASTMADEGEERAGTLLALLERRHTNLSVIVVLRHATQIAIVSLVLAQVDQSTPGGLTWAGALTGLVLGLVTVEALAKIVAVVHTDAVAIRVGPIARIVTRIPVISQIGELLSWMIRRRAVDAHTGRNRPQVSEEELLAFAEVAVEAEAIEQGEQALIASIIEFGDTIVREVMVPRPDMVTVEASWRIRDVMEVVILNGYSRLPVTGDGIDDIVGIAYAKDLMRAERDGGGDLLVGDHLRRARFVPEQQRVSVLLPEMQADQFHMAIVLDEFGGVAGLVTLEDLIEELVGEIVDEFDVEDPLAEPLPGGAYRVNARMPVDEVNDLIGACLPEEGDWDTLGGLVLAQLGHLPVVGESIDVDGHRITAVRLQGRRIRLVRVEKLPEPDPEPEGVES